MKKNQRSLEAERRVKIRKERQETKEALRYLIGEARTEAMYSMTSYEREYAQWN